MKTIYKIKLVITDEQTINLPIDSKILTIQTQGPEMVTRYETPCLWYLCNPNSSIQIKEILMFGTGQLIDRDDVGVYLGTFQMNQGSLVFHVFEKKHNNEGDNSYAEFEIG